MGIRSDRYKDVPAWVMENDQLRVAVLPDYGAKVASIFYKPLAHETLYQNPAPGYRKTGYGDSYLAGELSGFDDMFPTISECYYETGPWRGTLAPDHGELWSIPVAIQAEDDELRVLEHGVRFPYRFEKRMRLEGNRLRIDYSVTNEANQDFDFIWAAHPMFKAKPGMELRVPGGLKKIINSVPGNRLGSYGRLHDFPEAERPDGSRDDLRRVPPWNGKSTQKYWFSERNTEGWCALDDPDNQMRIRLEVSADTVPYLGVFVDEGLITGELILAPEPATGAMDRVDLAKLWGMNSVLPARKTLAWYLSITVDREA